MLFISISNFFKVFIFNFIIFQDFKYLYFFQSFIARNLLSKSLQFSEFANQPYSRTNMFYHLYIYFACLSVCLFVCLNPINVETAEPTGPTFCLGPHITPGKGWWMIKIWKISLQQILIFIKFWKSMNFFCFTIYAKMHDYLPRGHCNLINYE